MKILALNAYHGGSHKAFLDNWQTHSEHQWTVLALPANHWKWRMSHAAISFTEQLAKYDGSQWDLVFCTDMLNLAEFNGLAAGAIQQLPKLIYFHENQLTYPDNNAGERDLRYGFTNFISALAADEVWFNSQWHLDEFHNALEQWLLRMPDQQPKAAIENIFQKAKVRYPGIDDGCFVKKAPYSTNQAVTILWAARWEEDKNPRCLFEALRILKNRNIDFKLNMIGASSRIVPETFKLAEKEFASHIDHWGYVDSREDYLQVLQDSDLVISTALHEFFGIAVLEAVAAGCIPLVPDRLAYPETLGAIRPAYEECFYDGSSDDLANSIVLMLQKMEQPAWGQQCIERAQQTASRYKWSRQRKTLDENLFHLAHQHSSIKAT